MSGGETTILSVLDWSHETASRIDPRLAEELELRRFRLYREGRSWRLLDEEGVFDCSSEPNESLHDFLVSAVSQRL